MVHRGFVADLTWYEKNDVAPDANVNIAAKEGGEGDDAILHDRNTTSHTCVHSAALQQAIKYVCITTHSHAAHNIFPLHYIQHYGRSLEIDEDSAEWRKKGEET